MKHREEPYLSKLDATLLALIVEGQLATTSTVPVVVRCRVEAVPAVSGYVAELGGRVRHQLTLLGGVAAWVPLGAIRELAREDDVRAIDFEQEFAIA